MNFNTLFRAYDTVMALRDAARKFTGPMSPAPPPETSLSQTAAAQGLAGQIESRLTNVVVAALKEAFERDHARLELERAQLEEERRRADEALRHELRRQAIDRELARLRLLAGTALIGWIASIAIVFVHPSGIPSRIVLGLGWLLLLGALGAAFNAQGRINADKTGSGDAGALPLWLMVAGLAATAVSLLL
ncbi:MAG TPA: hypothetical protein VN654_11755 [Vicinamibacterales bacterium]|nr:hypothetical protein [Vicinamibacterales bacterium]